MLSIGKAPRYGPPPRWRLRREVGQAMGKVKRALLKGPPEDRKNRKRKYRI
jgi:hypothetical protein